MEDSRNEYKGEIIKNKSYCCECSDEIKTFVFNSCLHYYDCCLKCATKLKLFERPTCITCSQSILYVLCSKTQIIATIEQLNSIYESSKRIFKNVYYDHHDIKYEFVLLQLHYCDICKEKSTFKRFDDLREHMWCQHKEYYCLCIKNSDFGEHLKHYDRLKLAQHMQEVEIDLCKGHPICKFCNRRFYDYKQLQIHYSQHFLKEDVNNNISVANNNTFDMHLIKSKSNWKEESLGEWFVRRCNLTSKRKLEKGRSTRKRKLRKQKQKQNKKKDFRRGYKIFLKYEFRTAKKPSQKITLIPTFMFNTIKYHENYKHHKFSRMINILDFF